MCVCVCEREREREREREGGGGGGRKITVWLVPRKMRAGEGWGALITQMPWHTKHALF